MTLIVDTGIFVAAANRDDPHNPACVQLLRDAGSLAVAAPVIGESCYLIGKHLGSIAEAAFFRMLSDPKVRIEQPTPAELLRTAELVEQYADFPLGGTDASVVALAERVNEATIATLDRRHFTIVRPRHVDALTLVP